MVEQAHAKVTESRMGVMAEQGEVCLDDSARLAINPYHQRGVAHPHLREPLDAE